MNGRNMWGKTHLKFYAFRQRMYGNLCVRFDQECDVFRTACEIRISSKVFSPISLLLRLVEYEYMMNLFFRAKKMWCVEYISTPVLISGIAILESNFSSLSELLRRIDWFIFTLTITDTITVYLLKIATWPSRQNCIIENSSFIGEYLVPKYTTYVFRASQILISLFV